MASSSVLVRALSHWLSAHKTPALAHDDAFPRELLDDKLRRYCAVVRVGTVCVQNAVDLCFACSLQR